MDPHSPICLYVQRSQAIHAGPMRFAKEVWLGGDKESLLAEGGFHGFWGGKSKIYGEYQAGLIS